MIHLINKSALVAEIERRISVLKANESVISMLAGGMFINEFKDLLSFLDTLEVKEVDLEKEIELVKGDYEQVDVAWNNDFDFIAKHFFELGLKAKEAGYFKPANEDLEEAARKYADEEEYGDDVYYSIKATFKEGANWQKKQFEKNRLAACDAQTSEEAEREMNFAANIIEKEHRTPTYDDAIKYGMRLQKEEMMKEAINAEVAVPVYEGKDLKLTQLVTTDVKLNVGDKVKLIIIKD